MLDFTERKKLKVEGTKKMREERKM